MGESCFICCQIFSSTQISSHGFSTNASLLQTQGQRRKLGLLTTSFQRQNESEHSCCSRQWHHRPGCCWSLCLLPSQTSHGTRAGMTEEGELRVLEAQLPLLSGRNPTFQGFIAVALLLANAKGRHLQTIHCLNRKHVPELEINDHELHGHT